MGTSNWQNIPFCVETMMHIAPRRVLDVGIGFGRWGIIAREFCDVWFGRVHPSQWEVEVVGLEGYAPNVLDYHKTFYDRIVVGDGADFIRSCREHFGLVIFGDVLEHFDRRTGQELLQRSLAMADYVLVNVPLGHGWEQDDAYGNPFERHLAVWEDEDFTSRKELVRCQYFQDTRRRPFGSFFLSLLDPANIRSLPSGLSFETAASAALDPVADRLVTRVVQIRNQLEYITRSRSWRTITAVKRLPPYRLWARWRYGPDWNGADRPCPPLPGDLGLPAPAEERSEDADDALLSECLARLSAAGQRPVLAFSPENWLGVTSSTRALFGESAFGLPPLNSLAQVIKSVDVILSAAPSCVVLSGFAAGWWELSRQLRLRAANLRVLALWHGSMTQMVEPEANQRFYEIVTACQRGYLTAVGCVKQGMAEVFGRLGAPSYFVKNYLALPGSQPPKVLELPHESQPRVLILASSNYWRKNIYTQVAGVALAGGMELHVVPGGPEMARFAEGLGLCNARCNDRIVPPREVTELMRGFHLVLAATLSECCPMTPLESMSVGVPCLIGPNSHLFGDPYLDQVLVVPRPDSAACIAGFITRSMEHRQAIIDAYWRWAGEYQLEAQASVERFING